MTWKLKNTLWTSTVSNNFVQIEINLTLHSLEEELIIKYSSSVKLCTNNQDVKYGIHL